MKFIFFEAFLILFGITIVSINCQTDSDLVSCKQPSELVTDEVFNIEITLNNTGTTIWSQQEVRVILISKYPDFNENWGPWLIIQGQGTQVLPGETWTFSSPARAPPTPGEYQSSWQLQNWIPSTGTVPSNLESIPFLGKIVTCPPVKIIQRTEKEPDTVYENGVINENDFSYEGSFKLPKYNGQETRWTPSGLTMKEENGEKHFLLFAGTYESHLFEVKIPELEKLTNSTTDDLKTAEFVRGYGQLELDWSNEDVRANGGMYYDQDSELLYWTHSNAYYTGGPSKFPQLIATKLNNDETSTDVGYWHIPDGLPRFKAFWGGIFPLSEDFANKYTGGRKFALGFGGYYSICGSASRGPAIGAINLEKSGNGDIDLKQMLYYDDPNGCNRDGNYFTDIYWGTRPSNPWTGKWTGVDVSRSGVYIEGQNKKGFVFFSKQAINRVGYDYGGYNTGGKYQHTWIFYRESDFKNDGTNTTLEPNEIQPSSFTVFDYPVTPSSPITGSYFDKETHLLYLYTSSTWNSKGKSEPLVHVYRFLDTPNKEDENGDGINIAGIVISVVLSILGGLIFIVVIGCIIGIILVFGFPKKFKDSKINEEIDMEEKTKK